MMEFDFRRNRRLVTVEKNGTSVKSASLAEKLPVIAPKGQFMYLPLNDNKIRLRIANKVTTVDMIAVQGKLRLEDHSARLNVGLPPDCDDLAHVASISQDAANLSYYIGEISTKAR